MAASPKKTRTTSTRARNLVCLGLIVIIVLGFSLIPGVGAFCAAGVGAIAALCPLGILETFLAEKLMVPQLLIALICMVIIVALIGRTFCSWACPVPHITSFFHQSKKQRKVTGKTDDKQCEDVKQISGGDCVSVTRNEALKPLNEGEKQLLSQACNKKPAPLAPIGGVRNGMQIDSRHFVLVGALASSAVFGYPVFCLVCPVGLAVGTLVALWIAFVDHNPTWMLLVFPLILILELLVLRKWCHVFCPIGALMSLIGSKAPIGKPRVDSKACLRSQGIDCRACVRVCPEALDPHSSELSECTRCGLCVENCPARAVSMGFGDARGARSMQSGEAKRGRESSCDAADLEEERAYE